MNEKIIVKVKQGKVRGLKTKTTYSGAEYYAFYGIPYGQSTEGSARFKDPIEAKPWNNILDASVQKEGCRQYALRKKELTGSEDCLYNNIYTPKLASKGDSLKAVIVNIHPGGFYHGSPEPWYYGAPDYIMNKDVVYVCVCYRLHLIGFLNLHMKACSGNQGLKDIILSLQWIAENIHIFGGDPQNITLMGSSSGASLVHCLLLSPLAKGLFCKAILMGSYVFTPVTKVPQDHVSMAYELAKSMGYEGQSGKDRKLLNFFKNINYDDVIRRNSSSLYTDITLEVYPISPFNPTPEPGEKSPLPISGDKLIPSTNRVPVIIGFCEMEAIMVLARLQNFRHSIAVGFRNVIRQNYCSWGAALNENETKLIQKEVENFYLGGESIETASDLILCQIFTDVTLSAVYDTFINVISTDLPSSVYVYNFLYDSKMCGMRTVVTKGLKKYIKGAFHGADYSYWCYEETMAGKSMGLIQPKDRQIIETFTSLLTTFAKTSNPNYDGMNVTWKPTTPDQPSHLIIDETLQVKDGLLNGDRMEFWHGLKNKFQKDENSF